MSYFEDFLKDVKEALKECLRTKDDYHCRKASKFITAFRLLLSDLGEIPEANSDAFHLLSSMTLNPEIHSWNIQLLQHIR